MYKCKHFTITELVPAHVFEERGEKAWSLLDDRALETLDQIREKFGTTIVNNWGFGGNRQWSGLRTSQSPYGSEYSQHRHGRAFDCIFPKKEAEEVREYILKNQDEFPHIRGVELDTTWLHFDVGNRPGSDIYTFTK